MTKRAFSLSFSTIAVVVALLAVLLMVVIFFSRGFGTTEKSVANIMDRPVSEIAIESKTGGTLDISSWLPSLAKKWCSGACTKDADCCPADKPLANCVCKCNAYWLCTKSGCTYSGTYYPTETNCKAATACSSCGTGYTCTETKKCIGKP